MNDLFACSFRRAYHLDTKCISLSDIYTRWLGTCLDPALDTGIATLSSRFTPIVRTNFRRHVIYCRHSASASTYRIRRRWTGRFPFDNTSFPSTHMSGKKVRMLWETKERRAKCNRSDWESTIKLSLTYSGTERARLSLSEYSLRSHGNIFKYRSRSASYPSMLCYFFSGSDLLCRRWTSKGRGGASSLPEAK